MKIEESVKGDIRIISISGRMDTVTSKEVEAKLDNLINDNKPKIILNLSKMDYISSVGLRTLLAALKKQTLKRGQFGLICLQPFVENLLKITGLDNVFSIYLTEDAAILRLSNSRADEKDKF